MYKGKSRPKGKFDAKRISYTDLANPAPVKGGSITDLGYTEASGDVSLQAKVTTVRRFDQVADFLTQRNVTGADPIYGKQTGAHNIVYEASTPLIVGPEHESKYLRQEYDLIGERDRNIIHYFQGIDLGYAIKQGEGTPLATSA